MLLTYGQLKEGPCSKIAGFCVTSPDFTGYVNQAVRQLMRRGNWWGTVQPMRGCVYDNCITWPRYVGTVLAVNRNGHYSELANRWFQFMDWSGIDLGSFGLTPGHRHDFPNTTVFDGTTPVFNPIPCGQSRYVLVYPSVQADLVKTITLFGVDSNGQDVRQKINGMWSDGITLTLALPYVKSPMKFQKITRVLKDRTQGVVRLYQWDGVNLNPDLTPNVFDLAQYDPSETSPDYQHSKILGGVGPCGCVRQITALVKLAFIPVFNDNDLVLIENQDAISNMIQSIRYREKGDADRSLQWEKDAFRELNYELRDRVPDEQFVVTFRPFGRESLNRKTLGMI
jgi:hypothetical protein